tara:strand:- start:639 stop:1487 length:849 start_codon:yes stop_codon:yes gene_type:complete
MATAYEDLLAQLYGNIGTAGQKFTSNIVKPFMDQAPGVPLQGVAGPSDLQQQYFQTAANMTTGQPDFFGRGIGALDQAATTAAQATQAYDPQSFQKFMDPFQQNVIDEYTKEMNRQFDISKQTRDAAAQRAGAFGGDRSGVLEAEATRGFQDTLGRGIAGLLSSGFRDAQTRGMTEFSDRMKNIAQAATTQGNIGQTFGQFGQAAPLAAATTADILGKAGTTQQAIDQAGLDALFAQQQQQFKLPFDALALQSNIVSGLPNTIGFNPYGAAGGINPLIGLFS